MRSKTISTLVLLGSLCLSAATLRAQSVPPDTLLLDQFSDNRGRWTLGEAEGRLAELVPGGFHLRYRTDDLTGIAITSQAVALTDTLDYSLEVRLRVKGQAGLLWGYLRRPDASAPEDYLVLQLELDGRRPRFVLLHRRSSWERLFSVAVPAGFNAAAPHTLRVDRKGPRLLFYLDQQALGPEQPAAPWPGPIHDVGFGLNGTGAEAWVSRLLLLHHSRVRLAPGTARAPRRQRLGNGLNTTDSREAWSRISADGHWLYSSRSVGNPANTPGRNDDIWVAESRDGGPWGSPTELGRPINSPRKNRVVQAAPDGQSLLVNGRYDAEGDNFRSDAASQTTRQADGTWTVPRFYQDEMEVPDAGAFTASSIDASGTVQLVAGNTRANPANHNLYVSLRQPDGTWPPPHPLGPTINTPDVEDAPFLAADGKTLYFSSSGHIGYGSLDVFMARRLDDTWTKWSVPVNLGPAVNTADYENFFSISASGELTCLVSREATAANYDTDLYQVALPAALRPAPAALVRGRVLDARTKLPIANAELRYEQLPAGQEVGRLRLGGAGTYAAALPNGQCYGFRAEAPGYLAAADHLDLTDSTRYREFDRDLYLLPLAAPAAAGSEASLVLPNLFFGTMAQKSLLLPASYPELNRLAQTLKDNPGLRGRFDGYVDKQDKRRLGAQRAQAVKAYLVQQGVAADRLHAQGSSNRQPVAPNDSEANKRQNRRVEFIIVSR